MTSPPRIFVRPFAVRAPIAALSVFCSLLAGCFSDSGGGTVATAPQSTVPVSTSKNAYGESELHNPDALNGGVVMKLGGGMAVLSLEAANTNAEIYEDLADPGADVIYFDVPADEMVSLALSDAQLAIIASMTIRDMDGVDMLSVDANQRQDTDWLPAGRYLLIVTAKHTNAKPKTLFLSFGNASAQTKSSKVAVNNVKASTTRSIELKTECPGCDLSGVDLDNYDLSGVNLEGANLSDAKLRNTNFSGANLKNANLSRSDLRRATVDKASFSHANLAGAYTDASTSASGYASGVEHLKAVTVSNDANKLYHAPGPKTGPVEGSKPSASCYGGSSSDTPTTCPDQNNPQRVGTMLCTTQNWNESDVKQLSEVTAFGNDENIYPGAVLQGKPFSEGSFMRLDIPRSGGVIELTGLTLGGPSSKTLTDPVSSATVRSAIDQIIGSDQNVKGTAANISYQTSDAYSMDKVAFDLKLGGSYAGVKAEALFKQSTKNEMNTVFVKFTQVYYTASFQPPMPDPSKNTYPGTQFFRDGDAFQDQFNQIAAGSPPLYVSSASYGRQILFTMTSSASAKDLKAAFNVAYGGKGASAKLESGVEVQDVLKNTQINYVALGGSAAAAVTPLGGKDGAEMYKLLRDLMSNPAEASYSSKSPGSLIAYTIKYLEDGSPAAKTYSISYNKKDCQFLAAKAFNFTANFWNIDDDVYLYVADKNQGDFDDVSKLKKILYQNGRNVSRDLNEYIKDSDTLFVFKLGNHGCFKSHLDVTMNRDGQVWYKGVYDHNSWNHCGYQLETRIKLNKNTGEIKPVTNDNLNVLCVGPNCIGRY